MNSTSPTKLNDVNEMPGTLPNFDYVTLEKHHNCGTTTLAGETALAISYNGISYAVMMVSPGNIEDFVIGFSLANGIVSHLRQIRDISLQAEGESMHAQVELSNRAFWQLKRTRRQLAGTSGCGLCGVEALEQALPELTKLSATPLPSPELFIDLRQRISQEQHIARHSGALHAAVYLNDAGDIMLCREDIGRHNALDKLIGAMTQAELDGSHGCVVVTSRCSLELIHKAVRTGIGTLVSLSSPSGLSVQWARRYALNLIHLPQRSAPRCYSPAEITTP